MKKISYMIIASLMIVLTACQGLDLPFANWDMDEITALTATPGDMEVTLNWTPDAETTPEGFYISCTPSGKSFLVEGSTLNYTVDSLTNGTAYIFTVQADYGKAGRSGTKSVKCTPVTSRVPVNNLVVAAGNNALKATWTKPTAENVIGYMVTLSPGNLVIQIDNANTLGEMVTGLTNDVEYTVSVYAKYAVGNSEPMSAKVITGNVAPISPIKTYLMVNESNTYVYNDLYFAKEIASVSWNFGDGSTSTEFSPSHTFTTAGKYTVKMTANYKDGTSASGSIYSQVIGYKWQFLFNEHISGLKDGYGMVKSGTPVFASDGTIYINLCGNGTAGHLIAINPDGSMKWSYNDAAGNTYGAGPVIGDDGTIYFANVDKNVYAINPNGTLKWKYTTAGTVNCFPVIGSDGSVYVIADDKVLYAISPNGALSWSKTLDNNAGAVGIGSNGNIYAGTAGSISCFDNAGTLIWNTVANVTEKCSFAMRGNTLYAAQKGGNGIIAVSMSTGGIQWSHAITSAGDVYTPVIGKDGSIYFGSKSGKAFYALNPDGSEKWTLATDCALNYCSPAIDANNVIYFGSQANTANTLSHIYAINGDNGSIKWDLTRSVITKIMSGVSIGPDGVLYTGTLGNATEPGRLLAIDIFTGRETSSWSVRGGNYSGNGRQ